MIFTESFIDVTKRAKKLPTSEYHETGKYPIVDQGQKQIAGFTDLEEGLFTDIPAIIFGDHTRAIKYINTPFFIGADGVKVIKCIDKEADYKYIYYLLKSVRIPDTGYNRHYKWLKESVLPEHNKQQQKQIVETLTAIDKLIVKYNAVTNKFDELIKSRFVEMFGDPVSDSMNWGQNPLKVFLESIRYGTSTPPEFANEGHAFIRATNIKNGRIVDKDMKYIPQLEADRLEKFKLNGGEILIVRSGINAGDTCIVTDKYRGQYAGYDMILVLKPSLHPVFLNTLINTTYMEKVVKPLTRRAAQPHLNSEQTQGFPIINAPIDIQNQFADFVTQVEKQKTAAQKSIEKLETLKKSIMQKYFG